MPVSAGQHGRAGRAQCLSAGTVSHTGTQTCPRVLPSRLPWDKHILRPRRLRNAFESGEGSAACLYSRVKDLGGAGQLPSGTLSHSLLLLGAGSAQTTAPTTGWGQQLAEPQLCS